MACLPFPVTIFLFLCKYAQDERKDTQPLIISSDTEWSYSWKFTEPRAKYAYKYAIYKIHTLPFRFFFFEGWGDALW